MIGLEFLRHGNRFAVRIRRRYLQPEIRLRSQARDTVTPEVNGKYLLA